MFENLTKLQKITIAIGAAALAISGGIIIVLLVVLKVSEGRLHKLSETIDLMAVQHITQNVKVNDTIPLNSEIAITTDELSVGINMYVETVVPFHAEIPVNQNVLVPFKVGVKDYIKLDTTIMIEDVVIIQVDDTLPMNQKMKTMLIGNVGPSIRIKGDVPLKQDLRVSFKDPIKVNSVIPIDMIIVDTLPVGLQMRIPVDLEIPVKIPIRSTAKVSFKEAMPVEAKIPIQMSIPVDIPMEETSLAEYFRKMAEGMRGLTKLSLD
jgi:hypothetical protein